MEFLDKYSGIIALILLIIALVVFIRYKTNHEDDEENEQQQIEEVRQHTERYPLNLDDEDATVAALIASIDYREEVKKDVRVVSIREVR